jgi:tryptophan 2,3-dioxygenase
MEAPDDGLRLPTLTTMEAAEESSGGGGGGCPFAHGGAAGVAASRTKQEPVYYADYLELNKLLNAQHMKSEDHGKPAHDEMLFIIVHQSYELWFKQILHELDLVMKLFAQTPIPEKSMGTINHHTERIVKILNLLVSQVQIIETMSPLDFLDFRDYLMPASGFQSFQFRLIENKLGMVAEQRMKYQSAAYHTRLEPDHQKIVQDSENSPTLFNIVEAWLERIPFLSDEETGFEFWDAYKKAAEQMFDTEKEIIIDNSNMAGGEKLEEHLEEWKKNKEAFLALLDDEKHEEMRRKGLRRLSFKATQAALLITLYRDEPILRAPFELLTRLVDIDNAMQHWRHRHSMMVHRMIGTKMGTGGSSGYHYLKATLQRGRVFVDISNLSTYLLPRRALPQLPGKMLSKMSFSLEQK